MRGFILAAGFGQRLRPITESTPKPLLPIGKLPLIGYALNLFAHHGITEVAVNLHHLGKQLKEYLGDGSAFGVEITFSEEEEILGTGGGLKKMQNFLSDDTFVVVNGDTVIDIDLTAVIEQHQERQALATMVLREDPSKGEFGQIEIDDNERIRRLLGHGAADDGLRSLMFTGVHIMEPQFLDFIPEDVNTGVNRYAYTKALANDEPLYGTVIDSYWGDFGTPERYFAGNMDALEQRIQLSYADPLDGFAHAPKKNVAEVVRMGDDVQLGSDVRLVPPVILGDGTKVGDNTTVGPHCVIGCRVTIGKDAKVSNVVVIDGAKIEAGAVIDRSLVGRKASINLDAPQDEPEV